MTQIDEFSLEVHGVPELQRALGNDIRRLQREIVQILNKTAAAHRQALAKPDAPIQKNLAISGKAIKESITVRKAQSSTAKADLRIEKDRRLPLKRFGAKAIKNGIKYRARPGKWEKLEYVSGGDFYFVSPKLGNHAYKRVAGSRKVVKLHGASVWGAYIQNQVFETFSELKIRAEMIKQLNRRLQFILSGQYRNRTKNYYSQVVGRSFTR